jgi:hypothetical protein
MLHSNFGAAVAVAMAAVAVNLQIDQRQADLMLLELYKLNQAVNIQSVQAVQQFVAVSDVLAETVIRVL